MANAIELVETRKGLVILEPHSRYGVLLHARRLGWAVVLQPTGLCRHTADAKRHPT